MPTRDDMKFGSAQAYKDAFTDKMRTVSGRDEIENEIKSDIAKLDKLRTQVAKSIEKRDAQVSQISEAIQAIRADRSEYVLNGLVKILKPKPAADVRRHEADIARLMAKRARLFDVEMTLDECQRRVDELLQTARKVVSDIGYARYMHAESLAKKRQERANAKAAQEKMLEPYRKRIELGQAAMGLTRSAAAVRRKSIPRHHPCPYCGGSLGRDPVLDHIHPVARGGQSTDDNLVFACKRCNQRKRDFTLTEFIHRCGLNLEEVHERLIKQRKRF